MGSLSHSRLLLSPPFPFLTHDPTAGTFKGDGQKKGLSLFFFFFQIRHRIQVHIGSSKIETRVRRDVKRNKCKRYEGKEL